MFCGRVGFARGATVMRALRAATRSGGVRRSRFGFDDWRRFMLRGRVNGRSTVCGRRYSLRRSRGHFQRGRVLARRYQQHCDDADRYDRQQGCGELRDSIWSTNRRAASVCPTISHRGRFRELCSQGTGRAELRRSPIQDKCRQKIALRARRVPHFFEPGDVRCARRAREGYAVRMPFWYHDKLSDRGRSHGLRIAVFGIRIARSCSATPLLPKHKNRIQSRRSRSVARGRERRHCAVRPPHQLHLAGLASP